MYHVLLAVDGNAERLERQLDAVRDLPGRGDISVTLLYVHEEVDVPADEAGKQVIDQINEDIDDLQGLPDAVDDAQATLRAADIATEVSTSKGDPAEVILEIATERDANVICVAGRDRSPVGKAMFGSVTQTVILESDCPVIVS